MCVCMGCILHIFVRVFIRYVLRINLRFDSSAFARPRRPPESGRVFLKARCERVAWSSALQKLLKLFTYIGAMRVDSSGFWESYRLHSPFVGVTGSWNLTRADRETDLHRDLLAPRLYLENPVRASRCCEVVRSFGQVCVCVSVCECCDIRWMTNYC